MREMERFIAERGIKQLKPVLPGEEAIHPPQRRGRRFVDRSSTPKAPPR